MLTTATCVEVEPLDTATACPRLAAWLPLRGRITRAVGHDWKAFAYMASVFVAMDEVEPTCTEIASRHSFPMNRRGRWCEHGPKYFDATYGLTRDLCCGNCTECSGFGFYDHAGAQRCGAYMAALFGLCGRCGSWNARRGGGLLVTAAKLFCYRPDGSRDEPNFRRPQANPMMGYFGGLR